MRLIRRLVLAGLIVTIVAAATIAGAWIWAQKRLETRFLAHQGSVELTVDAGMGATRILERLAESGVIRDTWLARLYLVHVLKDPPLQAGEYRFEGAATTAEVLDKLIRGAVVTYPATVIEGLTLEETADALDAAGFGPRDDLIAEMRKPARIRDLDPEAENLEGYLFPDTYRFARTATPAQVVDALVTNFRRRFGDRFAARGIETPTATKPGTKAATVHAHSLRDVVILASIVEKESLLDDERPLVAGVYANRLRRGIALYADPTVIFAKKLDGTWNGNLRRADLKMDSPYNTYVYGGLPPGPIASPGAASLEAARAPADVSYLYFVSRNDGSHVFSDTLAEHNRNVDRWQRRYWRERWAAEKKRR